MKRGKIIGRKTLPYGWEWNVRSLSEVRFDWLEPLPSPIVKELEGWALPLCLLLDGGVVCKERIDNAPTYTYRMVEY